MDVGGTFTDVVHTDAAGNVTYVKVPSTPADQSVGAMAGLERLAERLGLPLAALLAGTERIVHGTTVATNALLERKGATVALLTTAGHRDVVEMREGLKPERYDLRLPRAEPLVPRHARIPVVERLRADGRVEIALSEASLAAAVGKLRRLRAESVAVCYLHSFRDPVHERATRDYLAAALPDVHVSLSADVLPVVKEYQRFSTTVVNAYVAPLIRRYLQSLEDRLQSSGFNGPLLVMLSHGGVAPVEEAMRVAAATVLSGPAGGVAGTRRVAESAGVADAIGLDMGGTSTDISLVVDGAATLSADRMIANEHIALPSLEITTLGAGGGSIAHIDQGGLLRVGPQSAGARPGPACYGFGGEAATVTDASLVLGYLAPDAVQPEVDGEPRPLDVERASDSLARLGAPIGLDAVATAAGVHRIVNTQMAEGIRLATVRRGVDPRRFALVGFGGAAGLHVTELAAMLGIERVLVPSAASVLSAWGMLATDLRIEAVQTLVGETGELDAAVVGARFEALEQSGRERMRGWHPGEIATLPSVDMRYGEQIFEINVDVGGLDWDDHGVLAALKRRFQVRHAALYTYSLPDEDPVLVNLRQTTIGTLATRLGTEQRGAATVVAGSREVYLDGWDTVPVHPFDALSSGSELEGPALVVAETTTVLLRRGDRARVTESGYLAIDVAGRVG